MTALAPRPRATTTVAALVDAAIDGDEQAWELLCEQHLAGVRAVAHARLRDSHAADDVVQETMVRAWTRLHQLTEPERLGAWLKTIAANVAIDHVRQRRATAPLDTVPDQPAPLPSHDDVLVAGEEAEVLHTHLGRLREIDRRALWQRDGHGVPVPELADELGMTPGSVRVLLTRARQKVRDGYGVLVAPVIALAVRLRSRAVGLGDAVPMAVAAPAMVVAVVAGVAVPALHGAPPAAPRTSIAVAPSASETASVDAGPTAPATEPPTSAPAPAPPSAAARPAASPAPSPPASRSEGPRVDLGSSSAGFSDDAPTDDDPDTETAAPGPVEGLELYLEETGLTDLGEADGGCLLCD
jgi:RNA polymerase sigma-70 factor, ECF subfamily